MIDLVLSLDGRGNGNDVEMFYVVFTWIYSKSGEYDLSNVVNRILYRDYGIKFRLWHDGFNYVEEFTIPEELLSLIIMESKFDRN